MTHEVVFLLDVDNTLLDDDRVSADLKRHLQNKVGPERQARYWTLFEQLPDELGYADYLGALQRYRVEHPRDPNLLTRPRLTRTTKRRTPTRSADFGCRPGRPATET